MQQATVNLFADMGVQPATLQSGLTPATASTDTTAPTLDDHLTAAGSSLPLGSPVTISGTATDTGGGVVGGVEVSVDGGTTWHPATGRESWTYSWTPSASGPVTIKSRAVDDSGNLETPAVGVTVSVGGGSRPRAPVAVAPSGRARQYPGSWTPARTAPWSWGRSSARTSPGPSPASASTRRAPTPAPMSATCGRARARCWRRPPSPARPRPGWQQVNFATPVAITANTVYVASYHATAATTARTAATSRRMGVDSPPLHALANGVSGGNGVYAYGAPAPSPTRPSIPPTTGWTWSSPPQPLLTPRHRR